MHLINLSKGIRLYSRICNPFYIMMLLRKQVIGKARRITCPVDAIKYTGILVYHLLNDVILILVSH